MKLEDALKQNPYDKTRGSKGAYIRYLRYTVDGWTNWKRGAERMNNVSLTGRLTREPELRYGGQDNSTAITRFTLAVDDGKDTDFINIKCFGRTAEWAQKWLSKGSRAEVTGKIKTGSYESQRTGSKVYYTEVVANSVGFGESKAEAEARGQQLPESDGFMNIPEGADEELPFN